MLLSASSKNWSFPLLTHKHCPHLCVCTSVWCLFTYVLCIQEVRGQHPVSSLRHSPLYFLRQGLTDLELPIDWNRWLRSPRSCQFPGMTGTNHHTSFSQGFWGSWTASTSLSEPSPQPLSLLLKQHVLTSFFVLFCFKYCQLLGHQGG